MLTYFLYQNTHIVSPILELIKDKQQKGHVVLKPLDTAKSS